MDDSLLPAKLMSGNSIVSMHCPYSGGPPMNNDVSGIGVRISFYLQTLFLGESPKALSFCPR
jgi:hypothetical protein